MCAGACTRYHKRAPGNGPMIRRLGVLTPMNQLLSLYDRISRLPFGGFIFTKAMTLRAPYFSAIRPLVKDLRSGYCEVAMRDHRSLRNKFGKISTGAVCTLSDLTGRLAIDASVPTGWRWIAKEMNIQYCKKPYGNLHAICTFDPSEIAIDEYISVPIKIFDSSGNTVVRVNISFYICSERNYEYMYV